MIYIHLLYDAFNGRVVDNALTGSKSNSCTNSGACRYFWYSFLKPVKALLRSDAGQVQNIVEESDFVKDPLDCEHVRFEPVCEGQWPLNSFRYFCPCCRAIPF